MGRNATINALNGQFVCRIRHMRRFYLKWWTTTSSQTSSPYIENSSKIDNFRVDDERPMYILPFVMSTVAIASVVVIVMVS